MPDPEENETHQVASPQDLVLIEPRISSLDNYIVQPDSIAVQK